MHGRQHTSCETFCQLLRLVGIFSGMLEMSTTVDLLPPVRRHGAWFFTNLTLEKKFFLRCFTAFGLWYCNMLEAQTALCYEKKNKRQVRTIAYSPAPHPVKLNNLSQHKAGLRPQAGRPGQGFPLPRTASLAAFPRPGNKPPCPHTYPTRPHMYTIVRLKQPHRLTRTFLLSLAPTLLNPTSVFPIPSLTSFQTFYPGFVFPQDSAGHLFFTDINLHVAHHL